MARLKKPADERLFTLIKNWLGVYLPTERRASPCTIANYRQALNQFLTYLADRNGTKLAAVTFDMMNADSLNAYLNHLQTEQNCTRATRNNRLAALRAFISYASACNPEYVATALDVARIKTQKDDPFSKVEYLTENAARAILAAPDVSTAKGRRDQTMLTVLYDTGARISELLELHLSDLQLSTTTPTATLLGKGGVVRTVPLAKETVSMLYRYLAEFHPDEPMTSCALLFFTSHRNGRQKMCAQTVRAWMDKYRETARLKCPEVPEHIHPHMWRHTRAMHLYQHGMPLELVAQWLGHRNPTTTLVYAYADTEHKRKAIEKAMEHSRVTTGLSADSKQPAYQITDEELLKRLYGLD